MQVAVWDTYVIKKNGVVMHFDILVPTGINDREIIYGYGKEYLITKDEEGQPLASKECKFCHVEEASQEMIASIAEKGYYIIEMQGCN